ncbi:hypothetical protein Peur_029861 [Populus x canadensis]
MKHGRGDHGNHDNVPFQVVEGFLLVERQWSTVGIVAEPEQVKEILNNKDGNYLKSELPSYSKKLFLDGLVATRDGKWINPRKLANHAFHGESLKATTGQEEWPQTIAWGQGGHAAQHS